MSVLSKTRAFRNYLREPFIAGLQILTDLHAWLKCFNASPTSDFGVSGARTTTLMRCCPGRRTPPARPSVNPAVAWPAWNPWVALLNPPCLAVVAGSRARVTDQVITWRSDRTPPNEASLLGLHSPEFPLRRSRCGAHSRVRGQNLPSPLRLHAADTSGNHRRR